jgi:cold shock CspA family protein
VRGKIVKFTKYGYGGFIRPDDAHDNVFFLASDVAADSAPAVGMRVEFDILTEKDGRLRAQNIRVQEV